MLQHHVPSLRHAVLEKNDVVFINGQLGEVRAILNSNTPLDFGVILPYLDIFQEQQRQQRQHMHQLQLLRLKRLHGQPCQPQE